MDINWKAPGFQARNVTRPNLAQPSFPLHNAVWPVSEHLRPRQRRLVRTVDDVDPRLLQMFPNIVEELNACIVFRWCGDAWAISDVPLDIAVALPVGGEA